MTPHARIEQALHNAKIKHPHFADNQHHMVTILTEEVGEVARSVQEGTNGHTLDELADTAAVCIRAMEMLDPAGARG